MCPSWDTFDTRGKVELNHARELVLGGWEGVYLQYYMRFGFAG